MNRDLIVSILLEKSEIDDTIQQLPAQRSA